MARSIPVIYNQLLQQKNSQAPLSDLNSTSQVSKWNLWLWVTAVGQNMFEQLCDLFQSEIEKQIANAPVFTPQWIVQMCKNFQYSSSAPQIVQLNPSTTYPYLTINYPVVNSLLCPVALAAVTLSVNGAIVIKVATLATGFPGPLDGAPGTSGPQCTALSSYLNIILPPNIHYSLINDNPDQILIQAQVYYNASYSGSVQANMDVAISNYLAGIPFNGVVTISDIENAMMNVPGVTDVVLNNVYWRTDAQGNPTYGGTPPFGGILPTNSYYTGQMLVVNNTLISRNYQTIAGYVITEQTSPYTITNLITYIPS